MAKNMINEVQGIANVYQDHAVSCAVQRPIFASILARRCEQPRASEAIKRARMRGSGHKPVVTDPPDDQGKAEG